MKTCEPCLEELAYKNNLEVEIIQSIQQKIDVVGELLQDNATHEELAIILNNETVLSETLKKMAEAFSKETIKTIQQAFDLVARYPFLKYGEEIIGISELTYFLSDYKACGTECSCY